MGITLGLWWRKFVLADYHCHLEDNGCDTSRNVLVALTVVAGWVGVFLESDYRLCSGSAL